MIDNADLILAAHNSCFTTKQQDLVFNIERFYKRTGVLSNKQRLCLEQIITRYEQREALK